MREIKFRAKVKYNGNHYFAGEWVIGHYHQNENGEHLIFDNEENYIENIGDFTAYTDVEIDETTLDQYTGLKDKNGKEIYEGDKIKYQDRDYSEVFGQGDVYYDGDDCMFKIRCNNVILFFMNLLGEELEVIGNIHDKENK